MAATLDPYLADLERLHTDLDRIAERDPVFLPVGTKRQALLLMASASSRAQAVLARLVACADDVADAEGHRDVASWLTHRTHDSLTTSRRAQRLGVACEQRWHRVGLALLGGRVTPDQGQVIAAALDELACGRDLVDAPAEEWAEVLVRAEAYLVAQAVDFGARGPAAYDAVNAAPGRRHGVGPGSRSGVGRAEADHDAGVVHQPSPGERRGGGCGRRRATGAVRAAAGGGVLLADGGPRPGEVAAARR
nr:MULTISPECIES: hypothetical protein [unclassified Nocardioides]